MWISLNKTILELHMKMALFTVYMAGSIRPKNPPFTREEKCSCSLSSLAKAPSYPLKICNVLPLTHKKIPTILHFEFG